MSRSKRTISRRNFLTNTGLTATGLVTGLAASSVLDSRTARAIPPNEKVVVGLVGCGGMGRANLRDFLRVPEVEVAALADPDPRQFSGARDDIKKADRDPEKVQQYDDFRKLIEREDIDAVIVATPDHWHAYIAIAAMQSGKDVYCEKPLAHNIREGRAIVEAAQKYQRVVQVGTQQRSGSHFQSAVELVRSGVLGKVHCCRTWIVSNVAPQGSGNPDDGKPPPEVDYNMWLGPAPKRPFNPNRFHYNFRWFWDYGNGLCNDWGVHLNDVVLWAMKRKAPLSVQAFGNKLVLDDNSDTPDTLEAVYDYGDFIHIYTVRRGNAQGLRQTLKGDSQLDYHTHGMQFEGTNGTLFLDRGGWELFPEGDRAEAQTSGGSDQHYPHVLNFLECVKNRAKPICHPSTAHSATNLCHLANISVRVGRKVYWDSQQEICVHSDGIPDTQANAYLFREPRAPWKLEV